MPQGLNIEEVQHGTSSKYEVNIKYVRGPKRVESRGNIYTHVYKHIN